MKFLSYLLLPLLFLTTGQLNAQETKPILVKDNETGAFYYEEVVSAEGITKEELLKRAKTWIIANMKTEDNNIIFNEADFSAVNTGVIKVDRKNFFTSILETGAFDFKFHIWCKDDRYKIRIDNIMFYLLYASGSPVRTTRENYSYEELKDNKHGKYLKQHSNEKLSQFIASFKKAMGHSDEETKAKNDW